ncbi:MAG: uroporphyrinogen-III C-methyltransferase [Rhodocyclaceae bacterium]
MKKKELPALTLPPGETADEMPPAARANRDAVTGSAGDAPPGSPSDTTTGPLPETPPEPSEAPLSSAGTGESTADGSGGDASAADASGGNAAGEGAAAAESGAGGAGETAPVRASEAGSTPGAAGRPVLPMVLAVAALLVAAAAGWQVYEQRLGARELRAEVAQRLNAGDVSVAELRGLVRQQQEMLAAMQGRIGALDAQVAATEGQAAALEALYQEYSRSRSDQVLAEVEQAINIAAQQLQLVGNFEAALIALEGAEARLSLPDQGHLQPLRRALIKDLDAVKAHPRVDVSGLALRLELLLERVDKLPLAYEFALKESAALGGGEAAADTEAADASMLARTWTYSRALAADIWDEIKGMVRLERLDQSDPALLAPAQSTFLRENVKVRLLTARLALLARDGRTFTADIGQARVWMERFFDLRDEVVARSVAELAELEGLTITAQPPSLEETFAALRLVQARAAASRSVPAADSVER